MAGKKPRRIEESSAGGAPAWMTTFSDCMTLLLTFFVLLLSFSSFDERTLGQLSGAFDFQPRRSIFSFNVKHDDSLAGERDSVVDRTDKGAEKPALDLLKEIENPKESDPLLDRDAYSNERILRLSSNRMFLGRSRALTQEGRKYLDRIASFMKLVPCKAIIGEQVPPDRYKADECENGLRRSWAVLQYLRRRQGLAGERLCLSATSPLSIRTDGQESVMQIALLARDITK